MSIPTIRLRGRWATPLQQLSRHRICPHDMFMMIILTRAADGDELTDGRVVACCLQKF
jgi:hypothetical protein